MGSAGLALGDPPTEIIGFVNNSLFPALKELDGNKSPQHKVVRSVFPVEPATLPPWVTWVAGGSAIVIGLSIGLWVLAIGAGIGMIGSLIGLRRFLDA